MNNDSGSSAATSFKKLSEEEGKREGGCIQGNGRLSFCYWPERLLKMFVDRRKSKKRENLER